MVPIILPGFVENNKQSLAGFASPTPRAPTILQTFSQKNWIKLSHVWFG
jgi:hypothetical protein